MPFKSMDQARACYAKNDPNWDCSEFSKVTDFTKLPKKVKKKAVHRLLKLSAVRDLSVVLHRLADKLPEYAVVKRANIHKVASAVQHGAGLSKAIASVFGLNTEQTKQACVGLLNAVVELRHDRSTHVSVKQAFDPVNNPISEQLAPPIDKSPPATMGGFIGNNIVAPADNAFRSMFATPRRALHNTWAGYKNWVSNTNDSQYLRQAPGRAGWEGGYDEYYKQQSPKKELYRPGIGDPGYEDSLEGPPVSPQPRPFNPDNYIKSPNSSPATPPSQVGLSDSQNPEYRAGTRGTSAAPMSDEERATFSQMTPSTGGNRTGYIQSNQPKSTAQPLGPYMPPPLAEAYANKLMRPAQPTPQSPGMLQQLAGAAKGVGSALGDHLVPPGVRSTVGQAVTGVSNAAGKMMSSLPTPPQTPKPSANTPQPPGKIETNMTAQPQSGSMAQPPNQPPYTGMMNRTDMFNSQIARARAAGNKGLESYLTGMQRNREGMNWAPANSQQEATRKDWFNDKTPYGFHGGAELGYNQRRAGLNYGTTPTSPGATGMGAGAPQMPKPPMNAPSAAMPQMPNSATSGMGSGAPTGFGAKGLNTTGAGNTESRFGIKPPKKY